MPCENCRTRDCNGGPSCPVEPLWALHIAQSPLSAPDGNRLPLHSEAPPPAPLPPLPEGVRGWCWGGFLLTWIWAFGNRHWIALPGLCIHIFSIFSIISFVSMLGGQPSWLDLAMPCIAVVLALWLGWKGREMAWRSRIWKDVEHFDRVQRRWTIAGTWICGILGVLGGAGLYVFFGIIVPGLSAIRG